MAVAKASGPTASAPRSARKRSSALALTLMTDAARAAVRTSYQGEEIDSRWDTGGGTVLVSDILHVSGGQTVTQTLATGTGGSAQPYTSSDLDGASPEGVLGVTTALVKMLETHYVVIYLGAASADNRAAQVVEAWRGDGSLAARFWLDSATKLPLEREVFDSAAHVISEGVFINIQIGKPAGVKASTSVKASTATGTTPGMYAAGGAVSQQASSWAFPIAPVKLLALSRQGWLVPPALPGGLILFTGGQTGTTSGPVLDLSYSDGLYVVTLFEQRGKLAAKLAGWQKTTVGGRAVYAAVPAQRSLTWAGGGKVYTVIADAPAQTLAAVVGTLPYDKPPGFWKRMTRGLSRLASLVNPFR